MNWEDELELRKAERKRLEERKYAALREQARQEKEYKDKLAGKGWGYQIQSVDGVRNPNFQPDYEIDASDYNSPLSGLVEPTFKAVPTGRGVVPTRETSPVRGYNGHTGDTRGVQESWWDGTDMGQGLNYMDQFPQIDGSDDSMREYMMGRRDMSGTIYDPTPSNFVPSAILDKPYTPSPKRQQKPSIWSDAYNSLNSIYDEYSPQLDSIWNNVPNIPTDAFDAGEYVLNNYAQPVNNFFGDAFQGISDAYSEAFPVDEPYTPIEALTYGSMADTASGIWGDFTGWLSGGDEIKTTVVEKETKDAYVEEVRKRYEENGFPWTEKEIKYAERQYEKEKAQGLL